MKPKDKIKNLLIRLDTQEKKQEFSEKIWFCLRCMKENCDKHDNWASVISADGYEHSDYDAVIKVLRWVLK